jgi:Bifunctional DNA primase/polymerase, N-terminal
MSAPQPYVPEIAPSDDTLTAALRYAAAGLYVGPLDAGSKHPGSVLGDGWQKQTTRDPELIAAWFAGTNRGVFIHAGRSGLLIFDVDHPDVVPDDLRRALAEVAPPYQTTRIGDTRRGHYLFRQPPGRMLGNSTGTLGGTWGEIRGRNGVIVVAPTMHKDAADGGLYAWQRVGLVPRLPDYLANHLPDALDANAPATDAEVLAFLERFSTVTPERPELLDVLAASFAKEVADGRVTAPDDDRTSGRGDEGSRGQSDRRPHRRRHA